MSSKKNYLISTVKPLNFVLISIVFFLEYILSKLRSFYFICSLILIIFFIYLILILLTIPEKR